MKFGQVSLTIAKDGEIDIAVIGAEYGVKNCASLRDLLRACRVLRAIILRRPHFRGCDRLVAICEAHTFPVMAKLGRQTGAKINHDSKVVSWQ